MTHQNRIQNIIRIGQKSNTTSMASNVLPLLPCRLASSFRRNVSSCFSINQSKTTRRSVVSTNHTVSGITTEYGEKNWHLEEEPPVSLKHFFKQAKDFVTSDVGPPRWFSHLDCGRPLPNSPLLLFLPGIDGTGLGLIMHHQKLGKIFEVMCLHIPPKDRTQFTDLVKLVERTVRSEHDRAPNRPIYLVGESLGACLALVVASQNPEIDLVLMLANPATSFTRSPLQAVLPLPQFMPDLSNLTHSVGTMAGVMMADLEEGVRRLLRNLVEPSISHVFVLADILPKETLLWKLQMMNSASIYANSLLHAVKAQTLILSSGKDPLLPSQEEGQRLKEVLENCGICTFEDCGHFLFLEDAFDLVTAMKQVGIYRRSFERDFVSDYLPPSRSELNYLQHKYRWINIMDPVMLSTLADGKIVRDLTGVPSEGPVVYVGNHMLLGFDIFPVMVHFSKQKDITLRGIAHPLIFANTKQGKFPEVPFVTDMRHLGAVPVSGKIMFKLLSTKSHVLLYPGGVREALHRKGEAYKLFWPEQSEFVRMAARFGAKIIPFGAVGEDDWADLLFDYEDQMKVPFLKKYIDELSNEVTKLRATIDGEEGNQALHFPAILPKFPGRFYYHFGKPIETQGRKQELRDRKKANELYLQVKSEVENSVAYLLEKRETDPYRSLGSRLLFYAANGLTAQVPAFNID